MAMTAAQYRDQLQALLPTGPAWTRAAEADLTKLLDAMAQEFSRVDGRADILMDEADPRTTLEMLSDWERVAALPSKCMAGITQAVSERRDALVGRLTEEGAQSRPYFIALAKSLGFTITITEFRPFLTGSLAGEVLSNGDWIFAWRVTSAATTVRTFAAGSGAGDRLAVWGNTLLECAINDDAPAHTIPQFAYV